VTERELSALVGTRVAKALGELAAHGYFVELPYTNSWGTHWFCAQRVGEKALACLTLSVHQGRARATPETSTGAGIEASGRAADTINAILEVTP